MAPWDIPFWIAHRGAGKLAPENTLAAFRVGAGFGFRAFECDVKLSADGVLFLLHDSTLARTTTGSGIAGSQGWSDLSRLDAGGWHSPGFAGEPLPSFEAIARYCLRNDFTLNVEIKPTPGAEGDTGRAVALAAQRLWAGESQPPLLSSFDPDALWSAKAAAPALPRALLLDTLHAGWFEEAQSLECVAVVTDHRLMDAGVAGQLHDAGMRAVVYTVNEDSEVRRLQALGIDAIITDAVDRFSPHAPGWS